MNKGRKISSHKVSTQIDEAIYNYMTSSCRDRNTAYFCLFFQRNSSIQFNVSSVWDLPTGKKESFWVNPSLISFCSLIFYFVFFIFLLLLLFVFWQTKCAHEKKKINLRAKIRFLASCKLFSRFARFRWGRFYFNQSKRCISILFRFNTSPRNDKMHK